MIWTGLLVGVLFGFALQRGRFCMNSAFRDILLMKDYTIFKAVAAAILVQMFGFAIMGMTGMIALNPKPLLLGANIIGSFVFGIGMVIAGGCASGITYRTGEGMVGAMSAVLGFSIILLSTGGGLLSPIAKGLQAGSKIMTADGKSLTVANVLGLPLEITMLVLSIIIAAVWIYFAMRNPEESFDTGKVSLGDKIFKRGWSWALAGVVIGLIGVISYPLSAATGRNYPLGISSGWAAILKSIISDTVTIKWDAMLIIGVVIGAAVAALIAKEFKLRAPAPGVLIQTFIGGMLMGFGASTSTGCNVGHILSGVPMLSIGSIVAGISIVLGAWTAVYLFFMRTGKA